MQTSFIYWLLILLYKGSTTISKTWLWSVSWWKRASKTHWAH